MSVSPDNVVPDATADEATVTIADDDADGIIYLLLCQKELVW